MFNLIKISMRLAASWQFSNTIYFKSFIPGWTQFSFSLLLLKTEIHPCVEGLVLTLIRISRLEHFNGTYCKSKMVLSVRMTESNSAIVNWPQRLIWIFQSNIESSPLIENATTLFFPVNLEARTAYCDWVPEWAILRKPHSGQTARNKADNPQNWWFIL